MKNLKKVIEAINANKELSKEIAKINYYDVERFINDAQRYIKAIQEGRMLCNIVSVSASGMSRKLRFVSMEQFGKEKRFSLNNYFCLFLALGYKRKDDAFTVNGCGMDMIFHTNYSIIHDFKRIGLITPEECAKLAQMTPQCI